MAASSPGAPAGAACSVPTWSTLSLVTLQSPLGSPHLFPCGSEASTLWGPRSLPTQSLSWVPTLIPCLE